MKIVRQAGLEQTDILRAANEHYPENYLSEYFDELTGDLKGGSGDVLAYFIVSELRETFGVRRAREFQVSGAIRALERARVDIGAAIVGLEELWRSTKDLESGLTT